jgi:hypothetical protein
MVIIAAACIIVIAVNGNAIIWVIVVIDTQISRKHMPPFWLINPLRVSQITFPSKGSNHALTIVLGTILRCNTAMYRGISVTRIIRKTLHTGQGQQE